MRSLLSPEVRIDESEGVMAHVFGGVSLTDASGVEVVDPTVQGRARCLLLLECCARYLADLAPLPPGSGDRVQSMTNLLAINIIEVTKADVEQLNQDRNALAMHLDIDMEFVPVHTSAPAKGVH